MPCNSAKGVPEHSAVSFAYEFMLDYCLDTMATTPVWQSEIAHTIPPTSEQTDIFRAALHHRSLCLFILHSGYFNDIYFGN